METAVVQPVLIAVLVVLEVAVWQVRVALATRGRKRVAAVLGAVNAVISVVALGQVVTHLDRPANIAGYAVGVAVGVYVGVVADGRFAGDPVEYRVVLPGDGSEPAGELRARGWPVTMQPAHGLTGAASVLFVVVDASRAAEAERDLDRFAPDGFRTSSRLRSATWTPLPPEYIVMSARDRLLRTTRNAREEQPDEAVLTSA
jgi:uncharacterized protein YebE (UPF0316 family)